MDEREWTFVEGQTVKCNGGTYRGKIGIVHHETKAYIHFIPLGKTTPVKAARKFVSAYPETVTTPTTTARPQENQIPNKEKIHKQIETLTELLVEKLNLLEPLEQQQVFTRLRVLVSTKRG